MSNKLLNIFSETFSAYPDALYKYLEHKGIEKVWLAEKITPKGQKVLSTQEKLSRWKREGTKPSKKTRNKIDEILGIKIFQNSDGKWEISRTEGTPKAGEPASRYSIDELLQEERSRLGIEDIPDSDRARELQGMLDDAVSLVLKLRRLIEKERIRSDD